MTITQPVRAGQRVTRASGTLTTRGGQARDDRVRNVLYAVGGTLAVLVFLGPIAFSLVRAFQTNAVITGGFTADTFFSLSLENFAALFGAQSQVGRGIVNSLIVALATAALTAVVATLAGYGFAKFHFRGGNLMFSLVVVSMMVPFQAVLTPLYLEMNALGLTDSLLGLVLFYTTMSLPFGVIVMRNSFLAVPADLEDSAQLDGAGALASLVLVLRPLILPGTITVALFAFLGAWTEFLGALTFLTNENLYTLPLALINLQQGAFGQVNYGSLVAGAVVAMVPCIVLYVALQRYYVAGLTSGALKG
ncbi:carbohydrate ABC transporter permease [Micrococcales bacterium 31B]|nr:carbohydrate ABC transporter permease [Micrococcales bacterium 31B]